MKLTLYAYAFVIFAVISIVSSSSISKLRRKHKKTSSVRSSHLAKDNGSGSWADGYNCPGILIGSNSDSLKQEGTATFYATKMENPPDNANNLGWSFKFTDGPGDNLKKVLTQVGTTKEWYLPYRYIITKCTYYNPAGNYKYIEVSVCNDSDNCFTFRVNLPYAYVGKYISDDEGWKICSFIDNGVSVNKNIVSESKQAAKSASSEYILKKPLSTSANTTANDLTTKIAEMDSKIKSNEELNTKDENELQTLEAQINEINDNVNTYSNQMADHSAKLSSLQDQLDAYQAKYDELKKSNASKALSAADLQKQATADLNNCNGEIDTLAGFAYNKKADIDELKSILAKADGTGIDAVLNRISPVN